MAARLSCFINFGGAICRPLSYYVGLRIEPLPQFEEVGKPMIDFDFVEEASDDLWADHESQVCAAEIARFSAADWAMLVSKLPLEKTVVQERIAQVLGDFNVEPAADLLLFFASSKNREIALTARESLRGMNLKVVVASARRLVSRKQLIPAREVEYKSINEILDAIESKSVLPGAA